MILEEYRKNLKPAALTLLMGGIIAGVILSVGGGFALTIGGTLGTIISIPVSLVSTVIFLISVDIALQQLGVDTRWYRFQIRLAFKRIKGQFTRVVRAGWRAGRGALKTAYAQLKGGIR